MNKPEKKQIVISLELFKILQKIGVNSGGGSPATIASIIMYSSPQVKALNLIVTSITTSPTPPPVQSRQIKDEKASKKEDKKTPISLTKHLTIYKDTDFVEVFSKLEIKEEERNKIWKEFHYYWTEGKGRNKKKIDWKSTLFNWITSNQKDIKARASQQNFYHRSKPNPNRLSGGGNTGNKATLIIPEAKEV